MKQWQLCRINAPVLFLLSLTQIQAAFISLQNHGFEANYPHCPNNTHWNYAVIDGWNMYDPQGIMQHGNVGISNPTKCTQCSTGFGVSMSDSLFKDSAPEAHSILFLHINSTQENKGRIGIEQSLPYTLTANTTYTLSAWIGNPQNNCWTNSSYGANLCTESLSGFPGYIMQLLAGDAILVQDDNSIDIPDAEWRMSAIQFTPSPNHSALGNPLKIRLIHKNYAVNHGREVWFDDIRLNAIVSTTSPTADPKSTLSQPAPSISPTMEPTSVTLPKLVAFYPTEHPAKINVTVHQTEVNLTGNAPIDNRYYETLFLISGASLIVIICIFVAIRMMQKHRKSAFKIKETSVNIELEMVQTNVRNEDEPPENVIEEVDDEEKLPEKFDDDEKLPEKVRDGPHGQKVSRNEGEIVTEMADYVNHEDDELDDVSNTPDSQVGDGDDTMQQTGDGMEGNGHNQDDDVLNAIDQKQMNVPGGKDGDVLDVINETARNEEFDVQRTLNRPLSHDLSISDIVCSLDR